MQISESWVQPETSILAGVCSCLGLCSPSRMCPKHPKTQDSWRFDKGRADIHVQMSCTGCNGGPHFISDLAGTQLV